MKIGKQFWFGVAAGTLFTVTVIAALLACAVWQYVSDAGGRGLGRRAPGSSGATVFDKFIDSSTSTVFIASMPPVATIQKDGEVVGKTNIAELRLPPGSHELRFEKDDKSLDTVLVLSPGKNPSIMLKLR